MLVGLIINHCSRKESVLPPEGSSLGEPSGTGPRKGVEIESSIWSWGYSLQWPIWGALPERVGISQVEVHEKGWKSAI